MSLLASVATPENTVYAHVLILALMGVLFSIGVYVGRHWDDDGSDL